MKNIILPAIALLSIVGCINATATIDEACITEDFTFPAPEIPSGINAGAYSGTVSETFTKDVSGDFSKITDKANLTISAHSLTVDIHDDGTIDQLRLAALSDGALVASADTSFPAGVKSDEPVVGDIYIPDSTALVNALASGPVDFEVTISGHLPKREIPASVKICVGAEIQVNNQSLGL